MEHNRKQKLLMIIALVAGIASLSVGFAAFSTTLKISSSASVSPSSDTFSVLFSTSADSLVVEEIVPTTNANNIVTTNAIIDNSSNPTISNISATFTNPGQYVVYNFYVKNMGEYTAYLNNINFIGEKTCIAAEGTTESLVRSACDYINLFVMIDEQVYSASTNVMGINIQKQASKPVKVVLEYADVGTSVDGPFSITLPKVSLECTTLNWIDIPPTTNTVAKVISGNLNDLGSVVSIGDEQFYVIGHEDDKIKLLSMYNLYVGNIIDETNKRKPLYNQTGIQDETAYGFRGNSNNNSAEYPFVGVIAFSSESQTGIKYNDYIGSIAEGYVNNYAAYIGWLGIEVEEARLITKEELEALGCSADNGTCSGAPEFIYKTTYWTGSASQYDMHAVWGVVSDASFAELDCKQVYAFGIRPVIEIPLNEF